MLWYRTVTPETELKTLATRQELEVEDLRAQQARIPTTNRIDNFTNMSAFQSLASGLRQCLFTNYDGEGKIGIVISCDIESPRNVIWRDSNHLSFSDAIFKKPLTSTKFTEAMELYDFISVSETEVDNMVRDRHKKLSDQYVASGFDRKDTTLGWTEGLFRYRADEIDGVVINPSSSKSRINGYAFLKVIEDLTKRSLQLVNYDQSKLCFTIMSRNEVKKSILKYSEQVNCQFDKYLKVLNPEHSMASSIIKS